MALTMAGCVGRKCVMSKNIGKLWKAEEKDNATEMETLTNQIPELWHLSEQALTDL